MPPVSQSQTDAERALRDKFFQAAAGHFRKAAEQCREGDSQQAKEFEFMAQYAELLARRSMQERREALEQIAQATLQKPYV
jgi:hypothetical protein